MPLPTLQQLYEEYDARGLVWEVRVAGATLPAVLSFGYEFAIGTAPHASIVCPAAGLPASVRPEAQVEIYMGFRLGLINVRRLVFGGGIIDSVNAAGANRTIEVLQDGARRLTMPYYRHIDFEFDNVLAQDAVTQLLDLAGVASYYVELEPWDIGTVVPQTLQFSTYGDAINKVATVDGSPWYSMPSGQIRVENRDAVPMDTPRRIYFSGLLTGPVETQPPGISNPRARPRILDASTNLHRADVANWIEVDGAVVHSLGPNGEDNSAQIIENVDGLPGVFPNGAAWIPTPPLFQQFTFADELIDLDAKAFEVAERYFTLLNRLNTQVPLQVPADPDVFLGETIRVIDPQYTQVADNFFVQGYRTSVDTTGAVTELDLTGGPFSGTIGFASPFADFVWNYQEIHVITGGPDQSAQVLTPSTATQLDLGPMATPGAKLCQDQPADATAPDSPTDPDPGDPPTDKATVIITFDGSLSEDFDGIIVSWAWSDDAGHTGSGPRLTVVYDPEITASVQMTLVVTDNTARTGTIVKTVFTSAHYGDLDPGPPPLDPTVNDTKQGGGVMAGPCTPGGASGDSSGGPGPGGSGDGPGAVNGLALAYYLAAEGYAMGTFDNRTWNDLAPGDFGPSGRSDQVLSVASTYNTATSEPVAIFGTSEGGLVRTVDGCVSAVEVFQNPSRSAFLCCYFDRQTADGWAGTADGRIYRSTDYGLSWAQYHNFDDGQPIYRMLTPDQGGLWVFGGSAQNRASLCRVDLARDGVFSPVAFTGDIARALDAVPEASIRSAMFNAGGLVVGFDGPGFSGPTPPAWHLTDPISVDWTPSSGLTPSTILALAQGHDADVLAAGPGSTSVFLAQDDETFAAAGDSGDQIHDMIWEGLDGLYLAAADGGLLMTPDKAVSWGYMRPNATFGTSWPGDAKGLQLSVSLGPRESSFVPPPGPADVEALWIGSLNSSGPFVHTYIAAHDGVAIAFISGGGTMISGLLTWTPGPSMSFGGLDVLVFTAPYMAGTVNFNETTDANLADMIVCDHADQLLPFANNVGVGMSGGPGGSDPMLLTIAPFTNEHNRLVAALYFGPTNGISGLDIIGGFTNVIPLTGATAFLLTTPMIGSVVGGQWSYDVSWAGAPSNVVAQALEVRSAGT